MIVAFFGAHDPEYPRTRVLREGLESAGVEVRTVAVSANSRPIAKELGLAAGWLRCGLGSDAILVPSFGHRDVPLARALSSVAGIPLLFDPLVSRWQTQAGDLGRVREGSLSARRLRASDRLALSLATLVLCDTWEHGDFFSSHYRVPRRKLVRVPVGADRAAFARGAARGARSAGEPLEVVFVGAFLPLHGMAAIVDAAARLEARRGARYARFTLVGDGMLAHEVDRDMAARGLTSIRRLPRMPYGVALDRLANADIALGIFGATEKAARVVPNKVFQSMALGIPTISRRSAAVAEFFRDGEHLALVPPEDGEALADAVEALAEDPDRRAALGAAGRAVAEREGSPQRIGQLLLEALRTAREATAPRARR